MRFFKIIGTIVICALQFACNRPTGASSTVSISLPSTRLVQKSSKVTSLVATPPRQTATAYLVHVSINVSGSGMDTQIVNWDSQCNSSNPATCSTPSEWSVTVATGDSRLFQVLAVYQSGGYNFFYGDATQSVSSNTTVEIPVTSIATTSSMGGQISGRYYDAFGNTPTGALLLKYYPTNRPPMIIAQSDIISGWFSVFGLEDTALYYEIPGQGLLFGGPLTLQAAKSLAKTFTATAPANIRNSSDNDDAKILVSGFFGNVPAGKDSCKPGSYTFQNRKDAVTSAFLQFPSSFTLSGSATTCGGDEYLDYVTFHPGLFDNNGSDSVAGFHGPFAAMTATQMLNYGSTTISWQYLPGITSTTVAGVQVFARPEANGNNSGPQDFRQGDGVDCASLIARYGFKLAKDIPFPATSVNQSDLAAISSTGETLVFCPYVNTASGAKFYNRSTLQGYYGGSGGGSGGPATQLGIRKVDWPGNFSVSFNCGMYQIELHDANGNMTSSPSPVTVSLNATANDPVVMYGSQSDCTNYTNQVTLPTTRTIPANQSFINVWIPGPYQMTSPSLNVTATDASSVLTMATLNLPTQDGASATVVLDAPPQLFQNICYAVNFKYMNFIGSYASAGSPTTIDITNDPDVSFYSEATCTTPLSPPVISTGGSSASGFIKYTGSSNSAQVHFSSLSGDSFVANDATVFRGSGAATPSQLFIHLTYNTFQLGECAGPYEVWTVNDFGVPIPTPSALTFSLTGNYGATFHMDNSCMASAPTMIAAGTYSTQFYVNTTAIGQGTFTASASGFTSGTQTFLSDGLHHVEIQTSPGPVTSGTCQSFTMAAKNLSNIDAMVPSDLTVNFSAGGAVIYGSYDCSGPSVSSIVIPTGQTYGPPNSIRLLNNTSSNSPVTLVATSGALGAGGFTWVVLPPGPVLPLDTFPMNIAAELTFDLKAGLTPFSGIGPFTFTKLTGAGTLLTNTYAPSPSDNASFQVTDSSTPTATTSTFAVSAITSLRSMDFTTSLPSGFSFTRSSTATNFDASGNLGTVAINAPRFYHNPDPDSSYEALGLLVETASTNQLTYSTDLTQSPWALPSTTPTNSGTGPENTSNGTYLVSDVNGGTVESVSQSLSLMYGDYVYSTFVKAGSSQQVGMQIVQASSGTFNVSLDVTTVPATIHSDKSANYSINNPYKYGFQKLNNGWYRLWLRVTSPGSDSGTLTLIPAWGASQTAPLASATGNAYFYGPQVENVPNLTSYIPTAASPVTRADDIPTMTINGTNLPGYTDNTPGTIRMQFSAPESGPGAGGWIIGICGPSDCSNAIRLAYNGPNDGIATYLSTSGGSPNISTAQKLNWGGKNIFAFSWGNATAQTLIAGLNGMITTGNTSFGPGPALNGDTFRIGNNPFGAGGSPLIIKTFEYWPDQLSRAGIISATEQ